MAKNYFERYIWLIDLVNWRGPISFKEISHRWSLSSVNKLGESNLPERTFHNHRKAILDLFGIEIKCDRSRRYSIADREDLGTSRVRQWLLESLSLNNLLNETKGMHDRILLEKIPSSQKWLPIIIYAMRDGHVIEMTYQSFWRDEPSTFKAEPYCLKLFKQRWYVLAKSVATEKLKIYALDERMINVNQIGQKYKIPSKFNADRFFADYFGIIAGDDGEPQEIKIRVVNDQVKYFDTLPLHESQRKVEDESDDNYTVYRFSLVPTFDFRQELLSHGSDVTVLSPEALRLEMIDEIKKMADGYGI